MLPQEKPGWYKSSRYNDESERRHFSVNFSNKEKVRCTFQNACSLISAAIFPQKIFFPPHTFCKKYYVKCVHCARSNTDMPLKKVHKKSFWALKHKVNLYSYVENNKTKSAVEKR